jgi:hypothetical protein
MTEAFAGLGIDWLLDWPPADASGSPGLDSRSGAKRRVDAGRGNDGRATMAELTDQRPRPEFGVGRSLVYYCAFWGVR